MPRTQQTRIIKQKLADIPAKDLKAAIAQLPPTEQKIALWYLGDTKKNVPKKELAEELGISKNFLFFLQAKALARLGSIVFGITPPEKKHWYGRITRYQEHQMDKRQMKELIQKCVAEHPQTWDSLTAREKQAISLFYGLGQEKWRGLYTCQVAKKMSVAKQRALVLVRKGRRKLGLHDEQIVRPAAADEKKDKHEYKIQSGPYEGYELKTAVQKMFAAFGLTENTARKGKKERENFATVRHLVVSVLNRCQVPKDRIKKALGYKSESSVRYALRKIQSLTLKPTT